MLKGKPSEGPKCYRLKPATWKEVRPFEWSTLTEQEQTKIARQARGVFQHSLKIPENDPIWNHVRYKNTSSISLPRTEGTSATNPRRASAFTEEAARSRASDTLKRGLSTRDAKEKRPKQKIDLKGEIMMKDESSGTTAIHKIANHSDKMLDESDIRRISDASSSDSVLGRNQVSLPPKPTRSLSSQTDKDLGNSSSSRSKLGQTRQPPNISRALPVLVQDDKIPGSSKSRKGWRDEDRSPPESERLKRPQQPDSSQVNGMRDPGKITSAKRKAGDHPNLDLHDPPPMSNPPKRLKPDHSESPSRKEDNAVIKKESRQLDGYAPRKGQPSSTSKPQKPHDSPPPPPPIKRQTISSSRQPEKVSSDLPSSSKSHATGSQVSKSTTHTKTRRPPIYTSSSEDDDTASSGYRAGAGLTSNLNKKKGTSQSRNNNSKALPTDHTALRARYSSSYLEYLSVFQRLVVEKGKIDSLLNNDPGNTDSDGDADLMAPDELAKLAKTHKELQEELETIQGIFGRTSGELNTDSMP